MSVKVTDKIIYPSRATFADALDGLEAAVSNDTTDAAIFLMALDYYATRKGIDFAVIASHAANECNLFRDNRFLFRKDAFGIGVTAAGVPGASFASYDDAAFYAVAEYCLKLRIPLTGNEVTRVLDINAAKYWRVLELRRRDDFPDVKTISQMNSPFGDSDCWWMCDENGPSAIVQKAKILFPNVSNQTGGSAVVAVEVNLVNRGFAALTDRTPLMTIHNTGSDGSARQEREFVRGGGGDQGVAYTFAVDEDRIVQILPLWKQGIHAGNVDGNHRSAATEMCMNREPWDRIVENTAQLLAMLHTRDERLDWSGAEAFTYSLPETTEHRKWAGANPNCPERLIRTHGGYPYLVQRGWEIVGGTTPNPIPAVQPHPVGGEATRKGKTFIDESGNEWVWFFKRFETKKTIQTYEYANVASRKGVTIKGTPKKPMGFYCYYLVAGQDAKEQPDMWGTTRRGWRFRLADVIS